MTLNETLVAATVSFPRNIQRCIEKQTKSCVLIQSAWLVMAEFQQRMTGSESIFLFSAAGFQSAAVINSSPADRVPGYRYFGCCFLLS